MSKSCVGLVGEELAMCELIHGTGRTIPRWIGAIVILFGIASIFFTNFLAYLIGGGAILIGILIVVFQRNILIPAVLIIVGALILLFPSFLNYAVALILIVVGVLLAIRKPISRMRQSIGLVGLVLGLLILVMPALLGLITGIALLLIGFIILMGALED